MEVQSALVCDVIASHLLLNCPDMVALSGSGSGSGSGMYITFQVGKDTLTCTHALSNMMI